VSSVAHRPAVLIVGNLGNRRVTGFVDALARRGWPPPILRSHRELLGEPERLLELPDEPLFVRLESVGEDPQVERRLLERGAAALPDDATCERLSAAELGRMAVRHGQLLAPRQHHAGLLDYLDALDRVFAARPSWRVLNPIADLRALFDKRETSRRYAAAGIPVPEPLPGLAAITCADDLRAAMAAQRWPAVFVKLSCASSASGLALYRHIPTRPAGERDMVLTTVAQTEAGRFNSLRLRRLHDRSEVDALLDWLIGEGVQIERAISKARLGGRVFDLRVLVVTRSNADAVGEPAFCVVRQSRHPITNLHLGGERGDLEAVQRLLSPGVWSAAMDSCVRAFSCHGCLHVGVDLMFEADLRGHRVLEANAFGDLLPGLMRAGKSVYEWEIDALIA
jgi:hypothetical protein